MPVVLAAVRDDVVVLAVSAKKITRMLAYMGSFVADCIRCIVLQICLSYFVFYLTEIVFSFVLSNQN